MEDFQAETIGLSLDPVDIALKTFELFKRLFFLFRIFLELYFTINSFSHLSFFTT